MSRIEKCTLHPRGYIDCSLCNSWHTLKISWKSIDPFCRKIANRQAAAPRWETVKQSSQAQNSLASYFLCRPWHFVKMTWKSVHPFFFIQKLKKKIDPEFKGLTATSQIYFRSFFVSCPNIAENLIKIHSLIFPNCCWQTRILLKMSKKISCVQGIEWNIPKMFQIVPYAKSHLPWKFHDYPFTRFSVMLLTDKQTNKPTEMKP